MVTRSRSYIATPPGATIKEQLEDRGMSQKEFASRMGMSEKHISHLINGDVQLTHEVAYKLEMVLGLPARFWNNLESIYREKIAKVAAENALDTDKELAKKFPYKEMAKYGWVPDIRSSSERVMELRKFFEVVELGKVLSQNLRPQIVCRRQSVTQKADFALLAWAQRAKIDARNTATLPIDLKGLTDSIPEIRRMTQMNPAEFCPRLVTLLANCGIALVFLPHIGGSFLHGATFYDRNKIVIGLTVRGKDADKFWFSLFHEIGHILLGHLNLDNGTSEDDEMEADRFARDTLIPLEVFTEFTNNNRFLREDILSFARLVDVDPGIVVGRLQKEGYIDFGWYNDLKTKYEISA